MRVLLLLTVCLLQSCQPSVNVIAPSLAVQRQFSFVPMNQALAPQATKAVKELSKNCPPPLDLSQQARVSRLFAKLLQAFGEGQNWLTPLVLSCKEVNAMSFPAIRQVVLFQGLLDLELSDDELSFILAHEIAHHLRLSDQIIENDYTRAAIFRDQVEKLRANCEEALKLLSHADFKLGLSRCKQTVRIWRRMNDGLYSQEVEQFVDEAALDVMKRMGLSSSIAIEAMQKISAGERADRPSIPELLESAWTDTFRSHPPAWKRLEYLRFRASF